MIRLARALDVPLVDLLPQDPNGKSHNAFDQEIITVMSLLDDRDKKILFDVASSFLKKRNESSS
jgi:hypothetical protein